MGRIEQSVDPLKVSIAKRCRRAHARWIERALGLREAHLLRIPTRKVNEGGFALLMGLRGGKERAEQWWRDAFAQMEMLSL